jgi:hypothetical protein
MTPEEAQLNGDAAQMGENELSSVKIIKNSRGTTWEIKAKHTDAYKALAIATEIDTELRQIYGTA